MMSVLLSSMKWLLQGHHVARLLGLFLLVTAGLKIHGLMVDPYGQENFLALPWLQVLTIEVEVLLGLWLLSGVQLRWAFVASLLLFCFFACLSFTLAWQGQSDCGCFGAIKVNPWTTFGIDVGIATMLGGFFVMGGWHLEQSSSRVSMIFQNVIQVSIIAVVTLGLIAVGATLYAGDPWIAISRLRGEVLVVSPSVTQLGEGVPGELRTFHILLLNKSAKPVRVYGGTTSCSCVTTEELPVTVVPNGEASIKVTVKYTGTEGKFAHRFVLYNDTQQSTTLARFSGMVLVRRGK